MHHGGSLYAADPLLRFQVAYEGVRLKRSRKTIERVRIYTAVLVNDENGNPPIQVLNTYPEVQGLHCKLVFGFNLTLIQCLNSQLRR